MQNGRDAVGHVSEIQTCVNMLTATVALQLVMQVSTSSNFSLVCGTDMTEHDNPMRLQKYLPTGTCAFETKLLLLTLTRSLLQVAQ